MIVGSLQYKIVTYYNVGRNYEVNGLNRYSGPSNLLLKGTAITAANEQGQIKTLRTCYTYDALSRRISETQPKGTGSTCS